VPEEEAAMTSERLAEAVRAQVALGRLLPLGEPAEGVWITEQAAAGALRAAAAGVTGVRLGSLRMGPDESGALHAHAAFEAAPDRPLPVTAQRLRGVLWEAAHDGLGLRIAAVDLTVTGLIDGAPVPPQPVPPQPGLPEPAASLPKGEPGPVPGARVTARLGGAGSEAYTQIAVMAGHRVLDVARAVREVAAPLAVLVTDVE
jgi:hypothetical protein